MERKATAKIGFVLDVKLAMAIRIQAVKEGRQISELASEAIQAYLDSKKEVEEKKNIAKAS